MLQEVKALDGHDLEKSSRMYELGGIVLLFMINTIIVRVAFIAIGESSLGFVAIIAASVTGASVFVYSMVVDTITNMYEEAMDAEESKIKDTEDRREIEQAIEDDRAWEEAQERAFEKEERERAEERSERGRFPFS